MAYRFDKARGDFGYKPVDVAKIMDVSRAAVTNWENGSRTPTADKIIQMAELYGVTTDYLLGISDKRQVENTTELSIESILARHDTPVWLAGHGWGLVNAIKKIIVFSNMTTMPIADLKQPVFTYPPAFALGLRGSGRPLQLADLRSHDQVWVEPISEDTVLQAELRGWYHPFDERLVRNEVGQVFYLDFYGSKWLAFKNCFESALVNEGI